jgi:hypothetical protein
MKHVKILGVVAVAAMAMMAFAASSASATALYNGATKLVVGATVDFSNVGTAKLTNTAGTEVLDECTGSTVQGSLTNAGGAGVAVQGNISTLSWTGCSFPTSTDNFGGLEVIAILDKEGKATTEGTIKANAEIGVTINPFFFGVCKYGVNKGEHLGVVKSASTGTATFTANATANKLIGSNVACPETTKWTATYTSTTPDQLRVEAS